MKLKVNGDSMEVTPGTTVTRLLEGLKLKPELVVVELNLDILRREQLEATELKEGDQVEIVHFVGGGSGETAPIRRPTRRGRVPRTARPSLRDGRPLSRPRSSVPIVLLGVRTPWPLGLRDACAPALASGRLNARLAAASQDGQAGLDRPSGARNERGRERARSHAGATSVRRPGPARQAAEAGGGTAGGGQADG